MKGRRNIMTTVLGADIGNGYCYISILDENNREVPIQEDTTVTVTAELPSEAARLFQALLPRMLPLPSRSSYFPEER